MNSIKALDKSFGIREKLGKKIDEDPFYSTF